MKKYKKTALVFGGSQGLGFAAARFLLVNHKVILVSRSYDRLTVAKDKLIKLNKKANIEIMVCDITKKDDIKNIFNKVQNVDILVSNTNGPIFGKAFDLDDNTCTSGFEDFFIAQKNIIENSIKFMKKNSWGRIIIVSSATLKNPNPNLALSQILRSAMGGYMVSISAQLIKDGITINSILAGSFETQRTKNYILAKSKELNISKKLMKNNLTNTIPIKRLGDPDEFGFLCSYLANDLSSFMTGQHLTIDGGISVPAFG